MTDALSQLVDAIVKGDVDQAAPLTRQALDAGMKADEIIQKGVARGGDIIGTQFEKGEAFLPELFMAADAMKEIVDILQPLLAESQTGSAATPAIIGTVAGDIHDIGKNLVTTMLGGVGFMVTDLGVDVSPQKFVEAAKEKNARLVALSALISTTMMGMREVVEAFEEAGIRDQVKILVGGAPVTPTFAQDIGADLYAKFAAEGAELARRELGIG
jgi:corrinoid protein of di/trimethylamine methyltransferase